MQFQRLSVRNWRCFEDESVQFENGVTVLYGNNGTGKSSLLEAAFFALYGADALDKSTTMDDVVTTDEDTAEVTLSFAHRGESYEVSREIRIRSSTTQHAELTTPPGQPDLEQTSAIDDLIEEELRLNADDFLNSAYVRQGDISRLIEATPKTRQQIIDNLLQMSKLETYRDRMNDVETGVGRVFESKEERIEELEDQIGKYDEERIRYRQARLQAFEDELVSRREDIDDQIEDLQEKKTDAQETVRIQSDLEEDVEEARWDVENRIGDLCDEVDAYRDLEDDLTDAEEDVSNAEDELKALMEVGSGDFSDDSSDAETLVDDVTDRAETLVSNYLGDPDDDDTSRLDDGGQEWDRDPKDVATSLLNESSDGTDDIGRPSDEHLDDISATIPPATPAVTSEAVEESTTTVASLDLLDPSDLDTIITPDVEIDVEATRVPRPGIDAAPDTLDVETAVDAHEETRDAVSELRSLIQAVETARDEHESAGEALVGAAEDHDRDAESASDEAADRLQQIAEIRAARTKVEAERDDLRARVRESESDVDPDSEDLHEALIAHIERVNAWVERLEAERNRHDAAASELDGQIERADELLDEGNCPRCGRPVEGAPEVEHLDEWKEERDTHRERVEAIEDGIDQLQDRRDTLDSLADEASSLFAEEWPETVTFDESDAPDGPVDPSTQIRPLQAEAGEYRSRAREERLVAAEKRAEAVTEYAAATLLDRAVERTYAHLYTALARQWLLRRIEEATDDRTDAERDRKLAAERLEGQMHDVEEAHSAFHESLEEYSEVTKQFDPAALDEAEQLVAETKAEIEDLQDERDRIHETENSVNGDLGELGEQLTQLEALREECDTRRREARAVAALREQVRDLETMFVDLREDLRKQNVERLEDLLREMFDTLYRNDAYADIELSSDYDATLVEKGGGRLSPTKLSGGESAVFNISLRGAIYRLLTEGFEDDVPMPPLILDEPTAHLDDGHVDRIDDVVDAMRDAGVEQTIVVSHDEELVDSAAQRIEVRQQQSTNRSEAETDKMSTPEI